MGGSPGPMSLPGGVSVHSWGWSQVSEPDPRASSCEPEQEFHGKSDRGWLSGPVILSGPQVPEKSEDGLAFL